MSLRKHIAGGLAALVLASGSGCSSIMKPAVKPIVRNLSIYEERIAPERLEKKVEFEGSRENIGNISVVYVKGTPYNRGFEQGRLMKKEARENIEYALLDGAYGLASDLLSEKLKGKNKESPKSSKIDLMKELLLNPLVKAAVEVGLSDAWKRMEPYVPRDTKEEMIGLADGSGIPLKHIQWVHAIPEITETTCSGITASGLATADGKLYQVRVLDYLTILGIQDRPAIIVHDPNDGNAFVNIGWAGFLGIVSGMNEKGIALCEMGYGDKNEKKIRGVPDPRPDETIEGIPMTFLLRDVLQYADNVDQTTGILRKGPRTNYYVFIAGDGITDSGKPESRGFLSTKTYFKTFEPGDPTFPFPALDNIIHGSHYQERCYDLLRDSYGQLSPEVLMNTIIPGIAMKSNLHTVVYDNSNLAFWVANALNPDKVKEGESIRAADQPYTFFDFGAFLKTKRHHQNN